MPPQIDIPKMYSCPANPNAPSFLTLIPEFAIGFTSCCCACPMALLSILSGRPCGGRKVAMENHTRVTGNQTEYGNTDNLSPNLPRSCGSSLWPEHFVIDGSDPFCYNEAIPVTSLWLDKIGPRLCALRKIITKINFDSDLPFF
jgi:hypothetical protein